MELRLDGPNSVLGQVQHFQQFELLQVFYLGDLVVL